jgi:glycerophosphoryl diester phosphodiesterase
VSVFAHRGIHQREPENTLAAFAEALASGVDGIELDVRQTACGNLVCFHDPFTRRLLGRSGRVRKLTLDELLESQVQHPTSRRRRPLATLDEALALLSDSVEIILDLKQESVRATTFERDTVALLRRHGLCESVVISSFNPWVLKRTRQCAPEFRTGLIAATRLAVQLQNPAYCDALHVHYSLLTRSWFQPPASARLVVWTVDQRSQLPQPLPDCIRGVISNHPRRLLGPQGGTRSPGRLA